MTMAPERPMDVSGDDEPRPSQEILLAFHEAHRRMDATKTQLFEASAQAFAVAELLVSKGLLAADELEATRRTVENRLDQTYEHDGLNVAIASRAPDKYELGEGSVVIDCETRIPLCKASCCRLRFPLSEQDIHEGTVEWQLDRPYLNRQRPDGYCAHCSAESHGCQIYTSRPAVCRTYDCREDTRIWVDFDLRIPNPQLP